MPNKDDPPETLLSIMDQAAEALISLIKDVDREAPALERPSVSEKIKAFEALTDYMKYREKPTGSAPANSKFNGLREKFNGGGDTTKGRGGRGRSAPDEAPADDSAPN